MDILISYGCHFMSDPTTTPPVGIEPTAFWLKVRRSTHWAKGAFSASSYYLSSSSGRNTTLRNRTEIVLIESQKTYFFIAVMDHIYHHDSYRIRTCDSVENRTWTYRIWPLCQRVFYLLLTLFWYSRLRPLGHAPLYRCGGIRTHECFRITPFNGNLYIAVC